MTSPSPFAIAVDPVWAIPLAGIVFFLVAVLVGWRWLSARPVEQGEAGDEVQLKGFLDGVTQDRRKVPRRRGNLIDVQLCRGDEAPIRGYVLDRSQGGLRVLLDQAVAEGKGWKIRPTTSDQTTPWTEVTIRSCRRQGAQYAVGCQFDQMPNWGLMLQFG